VAGLAPLLLHPGAKVYPQAAVSEVRGGQGETSKRYRHIDVVEQVRGGRAVEQVINRQLSLHIDSKGGRIWIGSYHLGQVFYIGKNKNST